MRAFVSQEFISAQVSCDVRNFTCMFGFGPETALIHYEYRSLIKSKEITEATREVRECFAGEKVIMLCSQCHVRAP